MKDIPLIFFSDPCFYATGQKFKPLDYVILLHGTILGMQVSQQYIF